MRQTYNYSRFLSNTLDILIKNFWDAFQFAEHKVTGLFYARKSFVSLHLLS